MLPSGEKRTLSYDYMYQLRVTLGLFAPDPNQGDNPPGPVIADVT